MVLPTKTSTICAEVNTCALCALAGSKPSAAIDPKINPTIGLRMMLPVQITPASRSHGDQCLAATWVFYSNFGQSVTKKHGSAADNGRKGRRATTGAPFNHRPRRIAPLQLSCAVHVFYAHECLGKSYGCAPPMASLPQAHRPEYSSALFRGSF